MTKTPEYGPGSIIEYVATGGEVRLVRVTARHDDVKRGEPGFDGVQVAEDLTDLDDPFAACWGYDEDITWVVRP